MKKYPCEDCPYLKEAMVAPGNKDSFVRVLHAVPNAPAVDIYIDGEMAIDDLTYGTLAGYVPISSGPHKIEIYPSDTMQTPILSGMVNLKDNTYYTLSAAGKPNSIELVVVEDYDRLVPKNTSLVKFIHLSPNAPAVDITTPEGQKIFSSVTYKTATPYLEVKPGIYDFQVRPAGQNTVVLGVPDVKLEGGEAYSIYALGQVGATPPLTATLVEDMM